jgi:hypothetical protein
MHSRRLEVLHLHHRPVPPGARRGGGRDRSPIKRRRVQSAGPVVTVPEPR